MIRGSAAKRVGPSSKELGLDACKAEDYRGFQLIATMSPQQLGISAQTRNEWKERWGALRAQALQDLQTPGTIVRLMSEKANDHFRQYGFITAEGYRAGSHQSVGVIFCIPNSTNKRLVYHEIKFLVVERTLSPQLKWDPPPELIAQAALFATT